MKVPIMSVNEAVDDIYSDSEDEAGPTEIECGLNGGDIRVPEPDENQNCEQIQWTDYPNGNWDDIQLTNFAAGPSSLARNVKSAVDAFNLFLTDEICSVILKYTTQRMKSNIKKISEKNSNLDSYMVPLERNELNAFFGLLVCMAVNHDQSKSIKSLWSSDTRFSVPIYHSTMTRNRFEWLMRIIRFDDMNTRDERKLTDKLAAIREMTSLFKERCKIMYRVSRNVTIDERIVRFDGRCPFKIYMPTKPDPYGIKLWVLADAESRYISDFNVYLGKTITTNDSNAKRASLGYEVTIELMKNLRPGHHLTVDNFFTSYKLAQDLLHMKHTMTGTIRLNRKEVPKTMYLCPDPLNPKKTCIV